PLAARPRQETPLAVGFQERAGFARARFPRSGVPLSERKAQLFARLSDSEELSDLAPRREQQRDRRRREDEQHEVEAEPCERALLAAADLSASLRPVEVVRPLDGRRGERAQVFGRLSPPGRWRQARDSRRPPGPL